MPRTLEEILNKKNEAAGDGVDAILTRGKEAPADDTVSRLAAAEEAARKAAEEAVAAAAAPGFKDRMAGVFGAARKVASDAVSKPGELAEKAAVGAVTVGFQSLFKSAEILAKGFVAASAQTHPVGEILTATEGLTAAAPSPAAPAPSFWRTPADYFAHKKVEFDSAVHDLATTKDSYTYRIARWAARKGWAILHWAARTDPLVMKPIRWFSSKMRDRLHKKIVEKQDGKASDLQTVRLRAYDGASHKSKGILAQFRNAAVNLVMAATLTVVGTVGIMDAAYSYGTYAHYSDVTITNVLRAPNNEHYVAEIHGYQTGPNGVREPIMFEVKWNPFYLSFNPQSQVSKIQQGDRCNLDTYGTVLRIPVTFRRMVQQNPVVISSQCYRPGSAAPITGSPTQGGAAIYYRAPDAGGAQAVQHMLGSAAALALPGLALGAGLMGAVLRRNRRSQNHAMVSRTLGVEEHGAIHVPKLPAKKPAHANRFRHASLMHG